MMKNVGQISDQNESVSSKQQDKGSDAKKDKPEDDKILHKPNFEMTYEKNSAL